MTYLIFIGDMLVMAFMVTLVVWLLLRGHASHFDAIARLPLDDEERRG